MHPISWVKLGGSRSELIHLFMPKAKALICLFPPEIRNNSPNLLKIVLGQEGKAKELNKVVRHNNVQPDFLRLDFLPGTEQPIPHREDDTVIAVMFLPQRGMVRPVQ
jgi:hypothetical protein